MKVKKISRTPRPWVAVAVLGAVAVAPVLSTPHTAQAQIRNARQQTVRGTVLHDLAGQKDFTVRLDGGRTVEVATRQTEPPSLSQGDRVELTGHYDGNLFIARNVRILEQGRPGRGPGGVNSNNVTLRGTVAADLAGNKNFRVRLDGGRTLEVVTRQDEPVRLSRGDRVEVTGRYDGDRFIARTVRILSDAGGVGDGSGRTRGNPNDPWVDFTGTVTFVDRPYLIGVRANSGMNYRVYSYDELPAAVTTGDTVRIAGRASGSTVRPDHVTLVRNNTGNVGRGPVVVGRDNQQVDFRGTVVAVESDYRLRVRAASDGRDYRVQTNDRLPNAVTAGDVVDVAGRFRDGIVRTDHIDLVRNNGPRNTIPGRNTGNGQTVNFVGTVLSVNRVFGGIGDLQVRGDNGQAYRVRTRNVANFERGDRVRVAGTYNNGTINATSVTRF